MAIACHAKKKMSTQKRFEGKTVMITGVVGGVGQAAVQQYLEEGASVAIMDLNPEIHNVKSALEKEFGSDRVISFTMDVSNFDDCKRVADEIIAKWGKIDVLAIVSGILHAATPIKDLEIDVWDRTMNVNLKGAFLLCKAVTPYMQKAKSGTVVTISSWWGHKGYALFSAYCSSKAGLIKFTQSLAEEMAPFGVRANIICPGNVNTSMHRSALETEAKMRNMTFEELKDIEWNKIPLKKAADPSEISSVLLFLTCDQSSYMTGATVDVNGESAMY